MLNYKMVLGTFQLGVNISNYLISITSFETKIEVLEQTCGKFSDIQFMEFTF